MLPRATRRPAALADAASDRANVVVTDAGPLAPGLGGGLPAERPRRWFPPAASAPAYGLAKAPRAWAMWILFLLMVVAPTGAAAVYYGWFATDRYASEARFVVRTASKPAGGGGLASLYQLAGISRAQDAGYAVQDYMSSRDAVSDLNAVLPLATLFSRPEADVIARYPSLLYDETFEGLHRYYKRMVSVTYDSSRGIGTLVVQAFRPEDARSIARELLVAAERLVNRMNERVTRDLIKNAEAEVAKAESELLDAQVAMTAFRNRELLLDPSRSSVIKIELIGKLAGEVAQARVQLDEIVSKLPNSPQAQGLRRRIAALEGQIAAERAQTSSTTDGSARQIAEFERLTLQRDISGKRLATTLASLEGARNDARLQQLYLEKIVEPNLADLATLPQGLRIVLTTLGAGLVGFLLVWLVKTSVKEHGAGAPPA